MPNIIQYNSPVNSLQPSETGIGALTQSALRAVRGASEVASSVEQLGDTEARANATVAGQTKEMVSSTIKDAGQVVQDYQNYQDKSKVSAMATTGMAGIEQQWQQTIKGKGTPGDPDYVPPADPNDPSVLSRFQENVINPFLDDLKTSVSGEVGRNYALSKADELNQHFTTQFTADAARLAGEGAVIRQQTVLNNLGNFTTTMPTIDNMDLAIKQFKEQLDINKSSAMITADGAAKLDAHGQEQLRQLVHAGVVSAVMKSGDPAKTAAEMQARYKDYMTPDENNTISNLAKTVVTARQRDANAQQAEIAKIQKQNALTTTQGYIDKYFQNPTKFSIEQMMQDPAYRNRPDLMKQGVQVLETMQKQPLVSDVTSHSNALTLMGRIAEPDGSPDKILDRSALDQAFVNQEINKSDYQFLVGRLGPEQANKSLDSARGRFFKDYALTIDKNAGMGGTPEGNQRQFQAQQEAIRQENILRAKGQDPQSLYDPNSPNYFGKKLAPYMEGAQAAMHNTGYSFSTEDMAKSAQAIKNIESDGGNYGAVSRASKNGDRAYGAYQVMGNNIPKWTKQYYGRGLTPQEFLQNKAAQDAVFEGEFGRLTAKYGPAGAARAWYAGEGGMNNLSATDIYGNITVGQYAAKFTAGLKGIPYVANMSDVAGIINKYHGQTIMGSNGKMYTVPEPKVPESK